jgi:hypothetical protein
MNLDREIEDLLAVDHSPEFPARVRRRIAIEPPPAAAWFSWKLLPIGAGAVTAAIAALLWGSSEPIRVAPAAESTHSAAEGVARTLEPAHAPTVAPSHPRTLAPRTAAARAAASRAARTAGHVEPEILLSAEDARAFRLLVTRAREGLVPELPAIDAESEAAGPPWIEIAPVVIAPIAQLALEEGERQ